MRVARRAWKLTGITFFWKRSEDGAINSQGALVLLLKTKYRMKAIILKDFGGVEQLQQAELPVPGITEGEVLIQTKAISINPVDVRTREGKGVAGRLKEEKPIILGWDISGVVKESKSPLFEVGDEVFGMINFPGHGKVYAEYVAAPADQLVLKPDNVSHEQAAAATLTALTAWQAFSDYGRLRPGQRVLIHAAAGGVGHYAVQIARHTGAYVIGTASAANKEFVLGLGANEFIDYTSQQLEAAVRNIDFVLDPIGGDNIDRSLAVMKKGGTIVSIQGGKNESVGEKAKVKGILGLTMMVQSSGEDMQHIAQMLEEGVLRSEVSKVFPFADMAAAHLQVETGKTRGKTVVVIEG
jgi:NADPH:quinone reductase-like Zn-dependent oxidoreductase